MMGNRITSSQQANHYPMLEVWNLSAFSRSKYSSWGGRAQKDNVEMDVSRNTDDMDMNDIEHGASSGIRTQDNPVFDASVVPERA
jgi:hypothetical protein